MAKLKIEYRTKEQDRENYFKDSTYFIFIIEDRTTVISIAANETRKLCDIVYGIEKELQDGFHLQGDEKFEISEFDKYVIEHEEKYSTRIDSLVYNFVKNNYKELQEGLITIQELISRTEKYIKEKISYE